MSRYCYGCMKPLAEGASCDCGYQAGKQNDSHQLPVGTVLQQRYLIGRVLGQGGFGITYIGLDQLLETTVAIKEFYPHTLVARNVRQSLAVACADDNAQEQFRRSRDRFLKEARTLSKLNEVPGIVHVQNVCLENNTAYIVMEYLEGMDLKQHMLRQNKPLTAEETLRFFQPVLYSLQKVHEQGLIHRDISPDNIMVLKDGNIKLLDFGAAREVNREEQNRSFASELVVKQGFGPIEQYRENADLGPSADVYALCASMYYCMTGQVPNNAPDRFMGSDNVDWKKIPDLTDAQIAGLAKGMAIRAEDRFSSVEQLLHSLYDSREAPEEKPEVPKPAAFPGKKSRLPALAAAVLLLAAAAAGIRFLKAGPAEEKVTLEAPTVTAGETAAATEAHMEETVPPTETTLPPETQPEPAWKKNLLRSDKSWRSTDPVVGTDIPRKKIQAVYFLDTLAEAPEEAWDVSQNRDRSVLAWTGQNNNALELYIAGEGGVNGKLACSNLFSGYINLKTISFNNCFFSEDARSMCSMFANCKSLVSVDLTGLDTSGVTDMSYMFSSCECLKEIDLSSFDTSKVANMKRMFEYCRQLKELSVGHFDTQRVMNFESMFRSCEKLAKVDTEHFAVSDQADTTDVFILCGSLSPEYKSLGERKNSVN